MFEIIAILATIYFCCRDSDNKATDESVAEEQYSNESTGTFVKCSSGYDYARDVHWTKKDKIEISEF